MPANVTTVFATTRALAIALLLMAQAAMAGTVTTLDPDDYRSFVGNWMPQGAPLCAAMRSADDWNRVLHPAATMGSTRPFAPPAGLWNDRAVLLIARVVPAGDSAHAFRLLGVERTQDAIEVNVLFKSAPPASSSEKVWLAVEVQKPLPALVRFRQEGNIVCALSPDRGNWVAPPLPK